MSRTDKHKTVFVEFDPPKEPDFEEYTAAAKEIISAGADAITLADCPGGVLRTDAFVAAAVLKREGINVLPHMTTRDRNLLAMRSLTLSLCALGIDGVLLVTGDRIKEEGAKGVYHMNSVEAVREISRDRRVYCALNISAPNFDKELEKAVRKCDAGASGFFTQPVLSHTAFENLITASSKLKLPIYGGILPVTSYKNACYMDENVSGISVCSEIKNMFSGLDRQKSEELSLDISLEIAKRIYAYIDGYYLITPFSRSRLSVKLIEMMRSQGLL